MLDLQWGIMLGAGGMMETSAGPVRVDVRGNVRTVALAFADRLERREDAMREASEVERAVLYRVLELGESWQGAADWCQGKGGHWPRTKREVQLIVERARLLGDDGSPIGRQRRPKGKKGHQP